jgi:hypothetical protein
MVEVILGHQLVQGVYVACVDFSVEAPDQILVVLN